MCGSYDDLSQPVMLILGALVSSTSCSSWLLLKKTILPLMGEMI